MYDTYNYRMFSFFIFRTNVSRCRKRTRTPAEWKQNIRKAKREKGESYTDIKGNVHLPRKVQKGCEGKCRYKCTTLLSNDDHQAIHDNLQSEKLLSENEHFRLMVGGFSVTITILKREI